MNNEQEKLNGCENCNGCAEEKTPETIPYIVHETTVARMERMIKKMWTVIVLLIVLLVGTNAAWLWYESQMEDILITQENADGYNNFIGNDGDITNNGETDNQNQTEENGR